MPRLADLVKLSFTPNQAMHLGAISNGAEGDFDGLSATGNNSQGDAYQIVANYNQFTTVGASTNSAKLPLAEGDPYGCYTIVNLGANPLYLFPASGDSLNNLSANTAYTIPVGLGAIIVKQSDTSWNFNLTFATNGVLPVAAGGTGGSTSLVAQYDIVDNSTFSVASEGGITSVTATDTSVVVATGDIVHITVSGTYSHGSADGKFIYLIARDTTGITYENRMQSYAASTGGNIACFSITTIDSPSAGTYTYRLRARTDAGTVYAQPHQVSILKFRTQ